MPALICAAVFGDVGELGMAYPFPSDDWIKALQEVLNTDGEYAAIAHNWEGDIVFVVQPDSADGNTMALYMDLWHGKCREAYALPDPSMKQAAFTLSAPLTVFTRIVQDNLDAMQAMMTRQLKVNGSMVYMMKNVPTILKFVKCCTKVDTAFTD